MKTRVATFKVAEDAAAVRHRHQRDDEQVRQRRLSQRRRDAPDLREGGARGPDRHGAPGAVPGATRLWGARQRNAARDRPPPDKARAGCRHHRAAAIRSLHGLDGRGIIRFSTSSSNSRNEFSRDRTPRIVHPAAAVSHVRGASPHVVPAHLPAGGIRRERFLPWLVRTRSVDKKLSADHRRDRRCASCSRPCPVCWLALRVAAAFVGFFFLEADPRKAAKKKLVLTARAKRILGVAVALSCRRRAGREPAGCAPMGMARPAPPSAYHPCGGEPAADAGRAAYPKRILAGGARQAARAQADDRRDHRLVRQDVGQAHPRACAGDACADAAHAGQRQHADGHRAHRARTARCTASVLRL